jgi:hypothetical protein
MIAFSRSINFSDLLTGIFQSDILPVSLIATWRSLIDYPREFIIQNKPVRYRYWPHS